MTEEQTQYLSNEKFDALKQEMAELKSTKIPDIAKRIDEARQMGDLSENAEYHAAREDMSWARSRTNEIQQILDNAQIISEDGNGGVIGVGSTIQVKVNSIKKEFAIVGAQEADPVSGKISNESPLGHAFLGRKKGDKIEIEVPAGKQVYQILSVS